MPACISNARFPVTALVVHLVAVMDDVWMSWPSTFGRCADICFAFHCAVHVPDPDATVFAAAIDVPGIGATGGAEVTSDEGFEDAVASKCDDGAVMWIRAVVHFVVGIKSVVKIRGVASEVNVLEFIRAHHLSQIPQFHHLVFAVAEHISPIAFTVDICETFGVTDKHPGFPSISHGTSVPNTKGLVI